VSNVPEQARIVSMLVLDVDGVLTDGTLYYGAEGELLKAYHVRDGLGVRLLLQEGVDVAVISARRAPVLEKRLSDLRIQHTYLGCDDKVTAFEELVAATRHPEERVAFVADDVLDLDVMRRVGLPIAVADAHPAVRREAAWVTEAPGGRGAVREVSDALLTARGRLEEACAVLLLGVGGGRSR